MALGSTWTLRRDVDTLRELGDAIEPVRTGPEPLRQAFAQLSQRRSRPNASFD